MTGVAALDARTLPDMGPAGLDPVGLHADDVWAPEPETEVRLRWHFAENGDDRPPVRSDLATVTLRRHRQVRRQRTVRAAAVLGVVLTVRVRITGRAGAVLAGTVLGSTR